MGRRWSEFLKGVRRDPVEPPSLVLTGCRAFDTRWAFARNPKCPVCGAAPREGHYCAACERLHRDDDQVIREALRVTLSPKPEAIQDVKDEPSQKPTATSPKRLTLAQALTTWNQRALIEARRRNRE